MWFLKVHEIAHLLFSRGNAIALVVTAGVAVFLFCCFGCATENCKEKDGLFRKHTF